MKEYLGLLMYLLLGLLKAFFLLGCVVAFMGAFVALGYFGMAVLELLFWDARPATYYL